MADLTREELAQRLAERAHITMAAARDEVRWLFDTIAAALAAGDQIRIHGFGTLEGAERPARQARNPRTGETVTVPPRRVVRFKPSSALHQLLELQRGGVRGFRGGGGGDDLMAAAPPPPPGPGTKIPPKYKKPQR